MYLLDSEHQYEVRDKCLELDYSTSNEESKRVLYKNLWQDFFLNFSFVFLKQDFSE